MLSTLSLVFFLAWRFISGTKESSIRLMIRISFFAIIIGAFALTLVAAIMSGIEKATHEKLQGINPDIIIRSGGKALAYDKIAHVLEQEYSSLIAATSPQALSHALITVNEESSTPTVVAMIGIDPQKQEATTSLSTMIEQSSVQQPKNYPLQHLVTDKSVLIGKQLAQLLGVKVGDSLALLFVPDEQPQTTHITLHRSLVTVGGIFTTGIDEYDTNVVFCSLPLFFDLFPHEGTSTIGIKLRPQVSTASTLKLLKQRFSSLSVLSWQDLYSPLVAALALEKYAMFVILLLISLMASMSIVSVLFMMVTHKRTDIAVLISMGMSQRTCSYIFICIGMGIALSAACIGIFGAAIMSWLLNTYPLITLPDVYYITHLPAKISWPLIAIVLIITLLLSFLATWLPVRRLRKITIPNILKN
jgi:ABC-type lipoprotein release transport system permease subunit